MSRNTNNSELPKNSGSEDNNNELIQINATVGQALSDAEYLNKKRATKLEIQEQIAICNKLATLYGLLQRQHIKLRDYYNQNYEQN